MDASDIFKKLTKGTKFVKKRESILQRVKQESAVVVVKKESDLESQSQEEPSAVTLLSSMQNGEERCRKRKKAEKKEVDLEIENTNRYRNEQNISVVGRHIPNPAKTFEQLAIEQDLIDNMKQCGYLTPTPVQQQATPVMLQKRNLLACAPTGSGKTAAFLLPIIHHLESPQKRGFRALVLCPTRELAKQTQRECVRLSGDRKLRVHVLSKMKMALEQYGSKSSQKFDVLITTPNRLCYLLKQDPPAVSSKNVQWLVIDEADKLFEKGVRSFRDQLDQILENCNNKDRKLAMFSATYAPAVAKWCVHNMRGLVRVTVGLRNAATDTIDQELVFVGDESGKLMAIRELIRKGLTPPVLVFVQSKERAQQLFNELIYDGINVDAIHADRTQSQRDNTVKCFREGRIWVLICTELMARGVDFKGVNLVINYDFPPSAIAYIHRIGRTGRAGREGKAVTFFTTDDTLNLRSIANILKQSGCEVPDYMLKLKKKDKRRKMQPKVDKYNIDGSKKKPVKRKNVESTQKPDRKRRKVPNAKGKKPIVVKNN